jgi:hypothetical protein
MRSGDDTPNAFDTATATQTRLLPNARGRAAGRRYAQAGTALTALRDVRFPAGSINQPHDTHWRA